jgi:hypothetical protein
MKKQLLKSMVAAMALIAVPVISFALPINPKYATTVEYWEAGTNANPNEDPNRDITSNALGSPDGNFLSLGLGGWAVFSFGTEFGNESAVIEITNGNRFGYVETANIYVSTYFNGNDLTGFDLVESITNEFATTEISLGAGPFTYFAIEDTSSGTGRDGFDIDAVVVNAVPEPTTMLLFSTGLLGLAAVSRRRNNS